MPIQTALDSINQNQGSPFGFKNRIINGAMVIDQRNAGASFTNTNQSIYGLDRWRTFGLSGAVLTIQQSTTAPTGFSNSQFVTVTTSTTANDSGGIAQIVEGNNAVDLAWGTSSGKSVTMSFWVRGSVTGTYNVFFIYNGTTTYYYVATYTIDSANTWEYKTITLAAPPTAAGAFANALNTAYVTARFTISSSGGSSTTANTWSTTNVTKSSGCVDLASNSGATFYITGAQLEVGTVATSFDFRSYGTELALCQRYYALITNTSSTGEHGFANGYQISTTAGVFIVPTPVSMRTEPTITITNLAVSDQVAFTNAATLSSISATSNGSLITVAFTAAGAQYRPAALVSRSTFIGQLTFAAEI